jgi:hypothetical protein
MAEVREIQEMKLQNKLLNKFWFPFVAITPKLPIKTLMVLLQIKPRHFQTLSIL